MAMKEIPIYLDLISNTLRHPVIGQTQRESLGQSILTEFRNKIDSVIDRYASLPQVMVQHGEYVKLLIEARQLFIFGYYYSCIAMCGIVVERIIKDALSLHIRISLNQKTFSPPRNALKKLEFISIRTIYKFLIEAGVIAKEVKKSLDKLIDLRNHYVHAKGEGHEKDARTAIELLHKIIEGTVSIFKDYEIQNGMLTMKKNKTH